MRVRCVANTGKALPDSYLRVGYTRDSQFDVKVGTAYTVYGISLRLGALSYLIDPEGEGCPNWYPVVLFELADARVPETWYFSFDTQHEQFGVPAVWGYEELVMSEQHFDGLMERDRQALRVFARRRLDIDSSG